ncbi:polyisoprenoid diphosphate/phosphate phosphohydrolase PLPP6 [Leptopilina boulardi]|uniref:polyisoprenoid diphosphate/phosphate phosphohydrolase PLPP6 n=1 Tax=Leptopilina boulardi TaxID=63433 RepID=UPI0021F647A5|nr:polyisoprenoid diphosphate/phosphate phosphohydrolase PLPP6 [Leptopilina boulardi]
MNETKKREVPSTMRKVLAVDAYITDNFVKAVDKFLPFRSLKTHYQALEISCHGILWIASWLAFIWILNSKNLYQMQVNFLIGIFTDILIIAIIKALVRRRRPTPNTDIFGIGPDKFSFPSGHASRASYIVYFFFNLWPVNFIFIPPLLAWSFSICLSRVLMRRHYLLDVVGGILLGITNGILISTIYLTQETSTELISWITDEKLDGGEYHV